MERKLLLTLNDDFFFFHVECGAPAPRAKRRFKNSKKRAEQNVTAQTNKRTAAPTTAAQTHKQTDFSAGSFFAPHSSLAMPAHSSRASGPRTFPHTFCLLDSRDAMMSRKRKNEINSEIAGQCALVLSLALDPSSSRNNSPSEPLIDLDISNKMFSFEGGHAMFQSTQNERRTTPHSRLCTMILDTCTKLRHDTLLLAGESLHHQN